MGVPILLNWNVFLILAPSCVWVMPKVMLRPASFPDKEKEYSRPLLAF